MNKRRVEIISGIEAEIQCMEACLGQGFTLQDYIDCQKDEVEILSSLADEPNKAVVNTTLELELLASVKLLNLEKNLIENQHANALVEIARLKKLKNG
jgi:hypothetical protein